MLELIIILCLIAVNGFFAMAEIALVSSRKSKLEAQADKGDKAAKKALRHAKHPDNYISTIQICITLIGLLTGIFSGDKIKQDLYRQLLKIPGLQPYGSIVATAAILIVISYLSLVFGELLPKRIGLSRPEYISKALIGPMSVIRFIIYPFSLLVNGSANLMAHIFKIRRARDEVTEDEIKAMINEGTEQGSIEEAEQDIIQRVFFLGDRNITSLMTHRTELQWIDMKETVAEVKKRFSEGNIFSMYPVCDEQVDNIKGTISIKKLLIASSDNLCVKDIMEPAMYVPENNTAYQVLEKFRKNKIHSCFIVDEYGTLQGLITINNILDALVGDIPQNEDKFEVVQREDGSLLFDGQIPFFEFLDNIDRTEWIDEENQQYDTLGGFILNELGNIPHTGETLVWNNMKFEIIDMDGTRIDKILVTILPTPSTPSNSDDDEDEYYREDE